MGVFSNKKIEIRQLLSDFGESLKLIKKSSEKLFISNIILQFFQAFLPIASIYVIKRVFDSITSPEPNFESILAGFGYLGLLQFFSALIGQMANYISQVQQQAITDHISALILEKSVQMKFAYFENPSYHDNLHFSIQQAYFRFPQLMLTYSDIFQGAITLLLLVSYFFTIHAQLAFLFLLISLPLAFFKWLTSFEIYQFERQITPLEREASYLHQILASVNYAKEVRLLGLGNGLIEKFKQLRKNIYTGKDKLYAKIAKYSFIAEAFEVLVFFLVTYLLAKQTFEKSISISVLIIYFQAFQRLQISSKSFLSGLVQIFQQRLFLKDVLNFLQFEKPVFSQVHHAKLPFQELSILNLSFHYPMSNTQVLNNISLKCVKGKIVALVGENGSGKSTLAKLLARLYEDEKLSIQLDSTPISQIDEVQFQQNAYFQFQDFEKFFFSIEENIILGTKQCEYDSERMESSALNAGAAEFIEKFPLKYQTRLGRIFEGSEQLSGGQWQKLVLSRLFYRKAKLIVLDEPSSSLDAIAEWKLFEELCSLKADRMILLITHRISNLKIADHIYVMDNGSIVQEGTFDVLLQQQGKFQDMYLVQKI